MKLALPTMMLAVAIASTCQGQNPNWAGITNEDREGPLVFKHFEQFQIGDWGRVQYTLKVLNVLNDTECLLISASGVVFLLRGFDTSGLVDDKEVRVPGLVEINDRYTYTAAPGGKKTVLVLEKNDSKSKERIAAKEAALVRAWTEIGKDEPFTARFTDYKGGKVHLERKDDGESVQIALSRLGKEDQEWVRDLVAKKRKKEKQAEQLKRKQRARTSN